MYFDGLHPVLDAAKGRKVTQIPGTTRHPARFIACSLVLYAVLAGRAALAQSTYLLNPSAEEGTVQRVRVLVEIQGELKTNPDGKKVARMPMAVHGSMTYEEKFLAAKAGSRRAIRYYDDAQAELKVRDNRQQTRLTDEHRLIVVQTNHEDAVFLSPHGPLTRGELDLLDIPGNSTIGTKLLPGRAVSIGESWSPGDEVLAVLLGLEAVSKSDVSATLARIDADVAIIDLSGLVQGAVGGVATEIELKGKLNFVLSQRRLTWLALALKENRSIGHAEPGFETVARIRVAIQPQEEPAQLTDKLLAGLPAENDAGASLLQFESPKGGYRLLHDRRWRAMVERHDVSILRLVDRGDLIAQCNISPLPDYTPGKYLPLAEFKTEIEEALGKNFGQIAEATQSQTDAGLRVLRVVATGVSSELPIQWIYFHVSNDQGRRATYVFTLEARLVERFGAADDLFTSSFEFIARPVPTPAAAMRPTDESKEQSGGGARR